MHPIIQYILAKIEFAEASGKTYCVLRSGDIPIVLPQFRNRYPNICRLFKKVSDSGDEPTQDKILKLPNGNQPVFGNTFGAQCNGNNFAGANLVVAFSTEVGRKELVMDEPLEEKQEDPIPVAIGINPIEDEDEDDPEGMLYRRRVINFLRTVNAPENFEYRLKKDLSVVTNLPFYGRSLGPPFEIDKRVFITCLVSHLIQYNDIVFAQSLLSKLARQQSVVFRSIAERKRRPYEGDQAIDGVWDHAIPTRFVIARVIEMIQANNIADLDQLLDLYIRGGQRKISRTADQTLNAAGFQRSMPCDWEWQNGGANHLHRYIAAGIIDHVHRDPDEL